MNSDSDTVPAGYRRDGQGRLVPESMIKPLDLARDQLVLDLVGRAQSVSRVLGDFREQAFADIDALVQLAAEEYGATLGGKKGNLSLLSFDGRYRVLRATQESIAFDERLQAAKALIDECLRDWTEGVRAEITTLINDAFRVDQSGQIRTGSVLALRRLSIDDERWQRAMQAIGDAVQVVGSKSYVRIYERVGDSDEYRQIPLDVASAGVRS
jgi:hypothetical protein